MTTFYALLLLRCGLSHREAAALHNVRLDTVKSWSSGRNPVPPGVITELRRLYERIEYAAGQTVDIMQQRDNSVGQVHLALAADDAQAQRHGWPCKGAQNAYAGLVAAKLDREIKRLDAPVTQ